MEGTVDVDGMLDRMTPEEFDGWCAKDTIEPIGYSSRMLGLIAFMLASYMSGSDAEIDPNDFMPWERYIPKKQHDNAAAMNLIRSVLGQ